MSPLFRALSAPVRRLMARPTFVLTTVVTLALGIGSSTAIYSVADGVLLRPLPYPQPHELVSVSQVDAGNQAMRFSRLNYDDVRNASQSYASMARHSAALVAVVGGTEPVRVIGARVSDAFLDVMGVAPARGRPFSAEEHTAGGPAVVLVSHTFAEQQLGEGSDPVGRMLRLGGEPHTVIGVMPQNFDFPSGAAFWTSADREVSGEGRTGHNWAVIARLHGTVTAAAAQQEASVIARRLETQYGDDTWMHDARVVPLRDSLVGAARPVIAVLALAVSFLLVVSGATVANLLLAQGILRAHEFAVRQAIGATGWRLLRQVLLENVLLVALGAALGLWLAHGAIQALLAIDPGRLPLKETIAIDSGAAAFASMLALGLALLLAVATTGRVVDQTPLTALTAGGRGGVSSRGVERMRRSLVVAQVAFTLVLLVGAGVLGQRLATLLQADPGFPTSGLLVVSTTFARAPLDEGVRRSQELTEIVARLNAIGQVASAGGINALPLSGLGANGQFLEMRPGDRIESFEDFGVIARMPGRSGYAEYRVATPGYFETMGIETRAGRLFLWSDTADAPHVAVVSESLARQQWPGEDAIGRQIQFGNMDGDVRPMTVVGVVRDVRDGRVDGEPTAILYGNAAQRTQAFSSFAFVVRGPADPLQVAGDARAAVRAVAADVPVSTRPVDDLVAATYGSQRFSLLVVLLFAVAALLLAVSGIYGVASYAVSSRTREIGVRMVLGADRRGIVRMVLREGLGLVVVGTALGVVGVVGAARAFASVLAEFGDVSPGSVAVSAGVIAASALVACIVPARRAARVEPATAIRD